MSSGNLVSLLVFVANGTSVEREKNIQLLTNPSTDIIYLTIKAKRILYKDLKCFMYTTCICLIQVCFSILE